MISISRRQLAAVLIMAIFSGRLGSMLILRRRKDKVWTLSRAVFEKIMYQNPPCYLVPFRVEQTFHGSLAHTYRYALTSLRSEAREKGADLVFRVFNVWRRQVCALRKTGWPSLQDRDAWARAVNCMPVSVRVTPSYSSKCKLASVCPWCWCRERVGELHNAVKYAICGTLRRHAKIRKPRRLVTMKIELGHFLPGWVSFDEIFPRIYSCKRSFALATRSLPGYKGAFQIFNVVPANPQEEEEGWRVEQRSLILMDPDCYVRLTEGDFKIGGYPCKVDFKGLIEKGKNAIVTGAGFVCRYPRQLVFGNEEQVFQWLYTKRRIWIPQDQREERSARAFKRNSGARLMEFYGELRNRTDRKREAKAMNVLEVQE